MSRHLCNDVITAVFSVIFVLGVKIIYLIDRTKISIFFSGWKGNCNEYVYQFRGGEREREREREPVGHV